MASLRLDCISLSIANNSLHSDYLLNKGVIFIDQLIYNQILSYYEENLMKEKMKKLLLISLLAFVSCKDSPFNDDRIRDAKDRGTKVSTINEATTTTTTSTSSTTTTTKPEKEALLDKEKLKDLTWAEIYDAKDSKQSLYDQNKKLLDESAVCANEEATFNKQECLTLLEDLLIITQNIDLITNNILQREKLPVDEWNKIKAISDTNYKAHKSHQAEIEKVKKIEDK